MRLTVISAMVVLACAACQHTGDSKIAQAAPLSTAEHEQLAFVQAACGGCHAVEPPWLSPNPLAPRWVDIANRAELSEGSLASWLRDAHNYPEEMDFDLDPDQVDLIASYMLTLRSPDYQRQPD